MPSIQNFGSSEYSAGGTDQSRNSGPSISSFSQACTSLTALARTLTIAWRPLAPRGFDGVGRSYCKAPKRVCSMSFEALRQLQINLSRMPSSTASWQAKKLVGFQDWNSIHEPSQSLEIPKDQINEFFRLRIATTIADHPDLEIIVFKESQTLLDPIVNPFGFVAKSATS